MYHNIARLNALVTVGLCGLLLVGANTAHAEKADRSLPIQIEADQAQLDQLKNVTVYSGNVIATQGTSRLTANKVTVTQDVAGNQYMIALGVPGTPATFKQRLDTKDDNGKEQWMNGYGDRIDYDSANHLVKIFDNGYVRGGKGDTVTGNTIVYDTEKEQFQASGLRNDAPAAKGGRVTVIIQPKPKAAP